ncbi:hypothetical protein BZZ01_18315 [Nostocales cyanobacterium HT-58-2]|nr:hypothetical protein BZZ01_18315 [Nostocales cyanobacterium HT-58-2]
MSYSSFGINHSGSTSVAFSNDLVNALSSLHVQVEGFGSTGISDGIADFAITGGAADVDEVKVEIIHDGGLTLKAADTTVDLTDFIISNLGYRTVLTGLVSVNGSLVTRAPLFELQVGGLEASTEGEEPSLNLTDVNVTLTSAAADTLNQVFGVTAFTPGFNIGTAQVETPLTPTSDTTTDSVFDITSTPTFYKSFSASPSDLTRGGGTSVALSNDLVSALGALQVEATLFGNTNVGLDAVVFPITGGAADLNSAKVDIIHDGGLTLSTSNTTVDLTDFIITNLDNRAVLTGLVSVNGDLVTRAPLFDLEVGSLAVLGPGEVFDLEVGGLTALGQGQTVLNIGDVNLTLTSDAAGTLNQVFGISAFTQGFNIGTAQVEALLG